VGTRETEKVVDKEAVFCWLGLWQWSACIHPCKRRCKL